MVPFDFVTDRYGMISNSEGVTNLSESFEVLSLSVMYSFSFIDVESITTPANGFVNDTRFLRAAERIFVRKERLNSARRASVLKNNCKVDKT